MEARNRDVEVFISLPKIIGQTKRSKIRYAISILFKDISQVHVDIEVHSAIKQSSCLASSNNRISVMEDIKGCPYILEAKSWGTSLGKTGLKMQLFSNRFHGDLVDFFKILNKNSYHPALHYRNMTKLAYDMARAFKHLHTTGKGYIHKDVKPKNIFINWGFTQHKVPIILHSVLGDYDLAAPLNDENKRLKTSGTLSYLSPEMVLLANKDNLPFELCNLLNLDIKGNLGELITTKMDQWVYGVPIYFQHGKLRMHFDLSTIQSLKGERLKINESLAIETNNQDAQYFRLNEISKKIKILCSDWEQSMIKLHGEEIALDWDHNFLNTLLWNLSRPHPQDRIDDDELLRRIEEEAAKIGVF